MDWVKRMRKRHDWYASHEAYQQWVVNPHPSQIKQGLAARLLDKLRKDKT